jgi:hypothetical protein
MKKKAKTKQPLRAKAKKSSPPVPARVEVHRVIREGAECFGISLIPNRGDGGFVCSWQLSRERALVEASRMATELAFKDVLPVYDYSHQREMAF